MTEPTHNDHPEPIRNWCKLGRAEHVTVHRQDTPAATGRIDMVALDGSVLWIIEDNGKGRTMIHRNDKAEIYRSTPQTSGGRAGR